MEFTLNLIYYTRSIYKIFIPFLFYNVLYLSKFVHSN